MKIYYDIDRFLYASAVNVAESIDKLWEKEKQNAMYSEANNLNLHEKIDSYFYEIIKGWILTTNQDNIPFLNIRVVIYDDKGNVISSSRKKSPIQIISNKCIMKVLDKKPYYETINLKLKDIIQQQTMRVLTLPIIDNNDISYMVRVAISVNTMNFALTNLKLILFILSAIHIISHGNSRFLFHQFNLEAG